MPIEKTNYLFHLSGFFVIGQEKNQGQIKEFWKLRSVVNLVHSICLGLNFSGGKGRLLLKKVVN